MGRLFDAILRHVPPPVGDPEKPLQLQITTLDYSDFLGRIIIGRVHNGKIKQGQSAALIKDDGSVKKGRISKLLGFEGGALKSSVCRRSGGRRCLTTSTSAKPRHPDEPWLCH